MPFQKGHKLSKGKGRPKGSTDRKRRPEVRTLRDMIQERVDKKLLDRVQKKNPEELVRAAVRLEAIFNPQKHIVSGDLKIEIVNYLGSNNDKTSA